MLVKNLNVLLLKYQVTNIERFVIFCRTRGIQWIKEKFHSEQGKLYCLIEFFAIKDLAVSGRPKSEFYVCLSADTSYLKIQVHSRTILLPLLVFIITLYISTTSKSYNSYLSDLAETAKFLIAKN